MIPKAIVVHHSLTADGKTVSWGAIRKYHMETNGWIDVGYHYGIELVGDAYEIFKGRMDNEVGAHCKQNEMNSQALGICLVGNFDLAPPPPLQFEKLASLVQSLMSIHGISKFQVFRHSDFATYKSCPGTLFPWDQLIGRL